MPDYIPPYKKLTTKEKYNRLWIGTYLYGCLHPTVKKVGSNLYVCTICFAFIRPKKVINLTPIPDDKVELI